MDCTVFKKFVCLMDNIPDEVVHNILSRLSAKPLMRFKCVSTYWNSQITESYFKSRQRILISDQCLYALKDPENVYSTVKLPFPFENDRYHRKRTIVVGTFYGIVILALERVDGVEFILYNPLTQVAQKLPDPPRPCCTSAKTDCAYGFGYGYGYDDTKIVIKYDNEHCHCFDSKYCHVFSLKKGSGSWTTPKTAFQNKVVVGKVVGVFLNGYLHWICKSWKNQIVALNVEDMEVSMMDMPDGTPGHNYVFRFLATLKGRLCTVTKWQGGLFDVWVMEKKKNRWSKEYSFTLGIERGHNHGVYVVCILEDGILLVRDNKSHNLIFYDPSKGSQNIFKTPEFMSVFATGIEYVESLASPSDISSFCALP